ncbi:MAG: amidohydrolase [Bacteroidales bacterium]|nr:amidohydrolase [Bacteroidales bacterium]
MKTELELIKKLAAEYLPEIISIRRHIHQYPELSFEEIKTSKFISDFLIKTGIEPTTIAKTGVTGTIKGNTPDHRTVALRADMDALPIYEKNDVPYKSKNEGIMHACGHDVHIACLLGATKILYHLKDQLKGSVKLIFQPSEEKYPGGAKVMIEEGILENPKPCCIFGQHVYPELPAGMVGMKSGKYMASTDEIFITVTGKGGHGAIPHKNTDPVLIASHIVVALQQIVSRNSQPGLPVVLSFGRFIADGKTNIIPDEAKIEGIMRTFDESWRAEMKKKITNMATSIAESMGAKCEVYIDQGYPFLVNDEETTERTRKFAKEYLGEKNVADIEMRTTAEDFAYFSQIIPGCFYRLGISNEERGITSNLHTATFDVDEKSLLTGMGLMAWIAFNELNREG